MCACAPASRYDVNAWRSHLRIGAHSTRFTHTQQREHAYLAQQLAKPRFRKIERALYLELRRRLVRDDATIPERIGSYEYFMRQSPGANYQVYCRRHCETQVEETVLDQNRELALAQAFQFVTAMKISHNERYLLLVMENEDEVCRAFVKDLKTQTLAPLDALHAVRNAEWCTAPDRQCFYYTRVDKHRRPYAVYRYDCGTKRHELVRTSYTLWYLLISLVIRTLALNARAVLVRAHEDL